MTNNDTFTPNAYDLKGMDFKRFLSHGVALGMVTLQKATIKPLLLLLGDSKERTINGEER